ncbi:MAG: ATP-binding cassette domain-containing protein [Oligoflexia bacterium]|nr:ATP-binding cassette domain-containing protein [Oligoflexia bacterium]
MSAALLSAEALRIGYRGTSMLPELSFAVAPGTVISIVGHNGSGKSTLLKTILGLTPKLGGEIRIRRDARLGYVPQRETMDPIYPVTVGELVETGRYGIRGVGRRLTPPDRARVREMLEATGTARLERRLFRTLSGGEQQRALLARALCAEPSVLVLDEPTASMDEKGAHEAMGLTLALARKHGAAIVMVNHFIDLVAEVSDQVIHLDRDHQRVTIGPPAEVLKGRGSQGRYSS